MRTSIAFEGCRPNELSERLAKETRQSHKEVERHPEGESTRPHQAGTTKRAASGYDSPAPPTRSPGRSAIALALVGHGARSWSLGSLSHRFDGLDQDRDRKTIARRFAVPHHVLASWLHTLTFIRNVCAHHFRLWNRELSIPPSWPKHLLSRAPTGKAVPRRLFTVLAMLTYLTTRTARTPAGPVASRSCSRMRNIPRQPMGFPDDWQQRLASLHPQPSAAVDGTQTR
ncbi:Abi family protein [Halomonas sp.]|uniref:Abi family protein n=1 Tax=Halomonas sp. TaxID=1486246 RepID=UPI003A10375E